MGAHMVARLIDAGHHVAVFDTRADAMAPHVARGARACESAGAVADAADTVLVSLPMPGIVRAVARELAHGDAIGASSTCRRPGPGRRRGGGDPERRRRHLPRRTGERRRRGRAGRNADDHGRRRRGLFDRCARCSGRSGATSCRGRRTGPGQLAKVLSNPLGQRDRDHGRGAALGVHGGLSARTLLDASTRAAGNTRRGSSRSTCCPDLRRGPGSSYGQGRQRPGRARRQGAVVLGSAVQELWAGGGERGRRRRLHGDRAHARAGRRGGGRRW